MTPAIPDIEKDLFAKIAKGDEEAFRVIFHEFNARLYHVVLKMVKSKDDAREIIQDVFLRLWLSRQTLTEVQYPAAWLRTIASNLALDHLRKAARNPVMVTLADEAEHTDAPSDLLERKEVAGLIQVAVAQLPASRRAVFELSRKHGLSRREIADKLGVSESTVKNQLTASLKFVQDYLKQHGNLHLPVILIYYFL